MAKKEKAAGCLTRAKLSHVRLSPQKARLVADLVRGKSVDDAVYTLSFCNKKSAPVIKKLILSAAANAADRFKVDADDLFIKKIVVDQGRVLKRSLPRAQGRATPIHKRHSTITVELDER